MRLRGMMEKRQPN